MTSCAARSLRKISLSNKTVIVGLEEIRLENESSMPSGFDKDLQPQFAIYPSEDFENPYQMDSLNNLFYSYL